MSVVLATRTLDEELAALARGESVECLVCGGAVEVEDERAECSACGARLEALEPHPGQLALL